MQEASLYFASINFIVRLHDTFRLITVLSIRYEIYSKFYMVNVQYIEFIIGYNLKKNHLPSSYIKITNNTIPFELTWVSFASKYKLILSLKHRVIMNIGHQSNACTHKSNVYIFEKIFIYNFPPAPHLCTLNIYSGTIWMSQIWISIIFKCSPDLVE